MTTVPALRDYSQSGEQEAILEWAAAQLQTGSFVDLGAYDGEQYSNTAALADLDWPGICVEAAPDAAAACSARYADRPDVDVIHAAFTLDAAELVTVQWVAGTMYTSLSGSKRGDVVLVELEVPRLDLARFTDQIARLPAPLFCSVDLEGASLEALTWLLENTQPACICVEANNDRERQTVRGWLADEWVETPLANHVNLLFTRRGAAA